LNPNGTLPSPFYGFNVPNGAKSSYFNGVAQAPDGSVVAAGQSWDGNDNSGLLVKFTVGGPNTGQTQFVDYLNTGSAGAGIFDRVAVQPDGKIVAAGSANPIFRSLWVVRTNADGTADTTFGNGGATFVNTNDYIYTVDGIALTPDSAPRIVANVFQMGGNLTPSSNAFQVVALTSDTSPTDQPYPTGSSAPTAIGVHQAENFDLGGEGVAYHDTEPQNLGGQYRPSEGVDIEALPGGAGYDVGWIHSGEFLNYLINSPTDAQYDLAVRVANYGSGGSFQIYVDGNLASIRNNFTPVYEPIPIPDTGSFTNYTDVKVGALSLSAGTHQIRIVFTGNSQYGFSGNVDSFTLAPHSVGGQPYTGTPFATGQRVEAENFDLGGEGVAYHDTEAQNLGGQYRPNEGVDLESTTDIGGGYDVGWAHAGEWLQYTGNFPTTGHYDFSARVANYGANGSIVVTVDGEYLTGIMAIPDTGGFQSWATIGLTNLTIPAGVHVVRIAFYGQSSFGFSGNLNWFEFAPTPTIQEVPWGNTPAPVPGTIQAENYDYGGEGLGYHDTDPQNLGGAYRNDGVDIESFANGQFAVDYAHAGEWMNYTVNIANSGDYTFSALVSDYGVGGQFHLELDGTPITNSLLVPNTGSFTSFSKVSAPLIHLISGRHVIRWVWDANTQYGFAGNVDSFSFT
jgi:hypothetical protein